MAAPYQMRLSPEAARFLEKLRDRQLFQRFAEVMEALRCNPRPAGCKKLAGRPDYRVRVGDYRIIYRVEDGILMISDHQDRPPAGSLPLVFFGAPDQHPGG